MKYLAVMAVIVVTEATAMYKFFPAQTSATRATQAATFVRGQEMEDMEAITEDI